MNYKLKIFLINLIVFLIIFDIIYLTIWIFSIKMNFFKALMVATIAVLITPWIKPASQSGNNKILVKIYANTLINKYLRKK